MRRRIHKGIWTSKTHTRQIRAHIYEGYDEECEILAATEYEALREAYLRSLWAMTEEGKYHVRRVLELIRRPSQLRLHPSKSWLYSDLATRGRKPRRLRKTWRLGGKQILMYPDLLRPHVDPNCTCDLCVALRVAKQQDLTPEADE